MGYMIDSAHDPKNKNVRVEHLNVLGLHCLFTITQKYCYHLRREERKAGETAIMYKAKEGRITSPCLRS